MKKSEEEARQKCIERNTKEVDMMRRFAQINTNGDQNLSAAELYKAFKSYGDDFSESGFQSQIDHFD